MNSTKMFLLTIIIFIVSFLLVGCGLIGSWRASSEVDVSVTDEVPEWLTIAHRAQAAEKPIIEPVADDRNQDIKTAPAVNQPASTQTGSTQPAQQSEQQTPIGGMPKWQTPGTMEYIAKQRLDQLVYNYKRLNADIIEREAKKDKTPQEEEKLKEDKKTREDMYKDVLLEIAIGLGLSLEKEYGIKPPPVGTTDSSDSTWFHNWDESPSGFNNP